MTLSNRETEAMKVRAWKKRAQGKGVRWRMIRDTMSVVSVYWMTSYEVETCLIRLWGLTRNKTKELLEEMVQIGDCQVEKDEKTLDLKYHLKPDSVTFWLGPEGLKGIPAGIVQVVEITRLASALEGSKND